MIKRYQHILDIREDYGRAARQEIRLEDFGKALVEKLEAIPDEQTFSTSFFRTAATGTRAKAFAIQRLRELRDGYTTIKDMDQIIDYLIEWGDAVVFENRGEYQKRCQVIT